MTPTGNQITDMLLGFIPTEGMEPGAGQNSPALNSGQMLFGDLLGGLMNTGLPSSAADLLQPPSLLPTPDALIGDGTIVEGDEVGSTPITKLPFDMFSLRGEEAARVDSNPERILNTLVNDGESGVKLEAGVSDNPDSKLNAFLPIAGAISTRHLMNIVEASKSTIEPGRYQITESSIADGKVNMQVVDSKDVSNAFKLSIPLTDLNAAVNQSKPETGAPNRVPLDGSDNSVAKIEKYISSLNLKELEVKSEPSGVNAQAKALPAEKTTSFVITAEKAGRQLSMRVRVNRTRVQMESDGPRQTSGESARTALVMPVRNINGARPATSVLLMPRQNQLFDPQQTLRFGESTGSMLDTKADLGSTIKSAAASMSVQTEDVSGKLETVSTSRATYSARLTLPDDIAARRQLSTKSIMLKIEPEHLGPARLHLMMRNDQLVAQVIVSSVNARAAIEGGLEDLARQLNEANIDVDSIDVSVAGDRDENNQFAQRAFWGQRAKGSGGRGTEPGISSEDATNPNQYLPPPTYVGTDGVNILA